MSMIKIEDLSFSYPGSFDTIFDHVSFQLDSRWKLGFVGRNGRGKTTLLRLLQGQYEYQGRITHSVVFDYFPYPVPNKNQLTQTVLEEVCPQAQEWELLRELGLLNVEPEVLERPFAALSGGEQCKVLLAALFLNEGHFLLIDEPTNHLDAQGRALVSAYLRRKKGFILVSHDRRFLDGCVDHILSLNRSTIEVQSGTFSTWFENFQRRQQAELEEDARLKKDISRLQQAARRSSDWSDRVEASKIGSHAYDRGFVGHKAAKMMKRAKALEARQEKALEEKQGLLKNRETAEALMDLDTSRSARQFRVQMNLAGEDYEEKLAQTERLVFELSKRDGGVSFTSKQDNAQEFYAMYGGFLFLGVFLGLLFLLATVLIIYYKQISEGCEDQRRFLILRQVGMSEKEINASIHSQILLVFFLPLGAAALHVFMAFPMLSRMLELFNLHDGKLFVLCTAGTLAVFCLIYALVFAWTTRAYGKIVGGTN